MEGIHKFSTAFAFPKPTFFSIYSVKAILNIRVVAGKTAPHLSCMNSWQLVHSKMKFTAMLQNKIENLFSQLIVKPVIIIKYDVSLKLFVMHNNILINDWLLSVSSLQQPSDPHWAFLQPQFFKPFTVILTLFTWYSNTFLYLLWSCFLLLGKQKFSMSLIWISESVGIVPHTNS